MRPHGKPLQPLCSWSDYWPDFIIVSAVTAWDITSNELAPDLKSKYSYLLQGKRKGGIFNRMENVVVVSLFRCWPSATTLFYDDDSVIC